MKIGLKQIVYIAYFIVLVFIGDRVFSSIINKAVIEKSSFRYSRLYKGTAKADLVFIGNSRGLSFYQPFIESLTGKSTFNLSYNGLPTDVAKVLLEDYVKYNGKPKLVVIEASLLGRRKEIVANFGCYSRYSPSLEELIFKASKSMGNFNRIFHLTRYNGEVFQRALYYVNKSDTALLNDRVISERALKRKMDASGQLYDSLASADYQAMIRFCRKEQIPFKIVINPYFPEFRKQMVHFDSFKERLTADLKVPIYDFSMAITSTNCFADYFHINKEGSKQLMQIFAQQKMFDYKE